MTVANAYWLGSATAVAQVTTIQVTAYAVGTTYKIIVGGVVISAIAAGSVNATALALATAWNASTHPYCAAVTAAAVATDTVTLTADIAGVPFVVTSAVSGSTGTIGSSSTTTASAGPNHWDTPVNWSTGAVPVSADNAFVLNSAVPILWGLDQSAVALALLSIQQSFTGTIGLPPGRFTLGAGVYSPTVVPEYRATYLAAAAAAVRIGENFSAAGASGSPLIKLDLGTTASVVDVFNCGTSADGLPPLRLKMNNASAALSLYSASRVGLCWEDPADTGEVSAVNVFSGGNGAPQVFIGAGVSQAIHNQQAGIGILKNAPAAINNEFGASLVLAGTGTITTLQQRGNLSVSGSYTVTTLGG